MTLATTIDVALALAFAVVYPWTSWRTFPAFIADLRAGRVGVRLASYRELLVVQWSLAVVLVLHWAYAGRSWPALGLGDPREHGVWPWFAAVGVLALMFGQLAAARRATTEDRARVREQFGEVVLFLPHDRTEHRWWVAVAITAGVCEELFYRGFLPWLAVSWWPSWEGSAWPLVVTAVLFGLAHAYQGPRGILKTMIVGSVMAVLVAWSGTLWPAILLHAGMDLHAGAVARWALRGYPPR